MWRAFILTLLLARAAFAGGNPVDLPAPLHQAMEGLRSGHYRHALEDASGLEKSFPGHPFPFLISAEARYGLIFCQTAHINSHEIWSEAVIKSTPMDGEFSQSTERALAASDAMRRVPQTAALGALYDGLAHGVRARLYTLRAQALKSATEGKLMRASLLDAIAKDPSFEMEADAGLGTYNYYADVLSPLAKMFRFFFSIPAGDREKGLAQLHTASEKAAMLNVEASYELAKILTHREDKPADALPLFRKLSDQYPENAIFSLSTAIQAEKIGNKDLAADYAKKAMLASRQMDDVCQPRLEGASQEALDRLTRK